MKDISLLYLPRPAVIKEVIEENSQIKTFILSFTDRQYNSAFTYQPGQFMMVSVPHCGEAPISFASSPVQKGSLALSVRKAGKLTGALHKLQKGAMLGLRGPYGNSFPMADFIGKDLLFVAGGIGLAPLCSVINTCIDQRDQYGKITVLYGSRTPSDIAFKRDIEQWQKAENINCLLTVDQAETDWDGPVGVVTSLFEDIEINPARQAAIVCGPPMMIKAVLDDLSAKGLADENIITTMERHMKCGVGVCRHCHMDDKLVCVDGPVFNLGQLRKLDIMEL